MRDLAHQTHSCYDIQNPRPAVTGQRWSDSFGEVYDFGGKYACADRVLWGVSYLVRDVIGYSAGVGFPIGANQEVLILSWQYVVGRGAFAILLHNMRAAGGRGALW